MAEAAIDIKARNLAGATIRQAEGQLRVLAGAGGLLAPQFTKALGPLQQLAGLSSSFVPLGGAITGIGAGLLAAGAAAGVMARQVADLAQRGENIGNLAASTGLTTTQVQVLSRALGEAGIDVGALNTGMRGLNRAIAGNDEAFARFGISTRGAGGAIRGTHDVLLDLAEAFSRMPDGARKTEAAIALLGRSGADLIPVLNQGRAGLEAFSAELQRAGLVIDEAMIARLVLMDARLDSLKRRWDGFSLRIGLVLSGVAEAQLALLEARFGTSRRPAPREGSPEQIGQGVLAPNRESRAANERSEELLAQKKKADDAAAVAAQKAMTKAAEETRKKLAEIAATLGIGTAEAMRLKAAMDELEKAQAAVKLAERVKEATGRVDLLAEALEHLATVQKRVLALPDLGLELRGTRPTGAPLLVGPRVPETRPMTEMQRDREEFLQSVERALEAAALVKETMFGVANALSSGLANVFQTALFHTKQFGDALLQLVQSIVAEVLATLAKIAALKILTAIFNPVGAIAGSVGASSAGGAMMAVAPVRGGGGSFRAAAPVTNVHVNISAFDTRSASDQFADPYGAVRQAFRRSAEVQAA